MSDESGGQRHQAGHHPWHPHHKNDQHQPHNHHHLCVLCLRRHPIVNRRTAWIRECLCSWEKERVNDGEPCILGEPHHHHGQRRPTTPNHPLLLLGQQISTPLCSQLYPNRGCLYGFATCTHHHRVQRELVGCIALVLPVASDWYVCSKSLQNQTTLRVVDRRRFRPRRRLFLQILFLSSNEFFGTVKKRRAHPVGHPVFTRTSWHHSGLVWTPPHQPAICASKS